MPRADQLEAADLFDRRLDDVNDAVKVAEHLGAAHRLELVALDPGAYGNAVIVTASPAQRESLVGLDDIAGCLRRPSDPDAGAGVVERSVRLTLRLLAARIRVEAPSSGKTSRRQLKPRR